MKEAAVLYLPRRLPGGRLPAVLWAVVGGLLSLAASVDAKWGLAPAQVLLDAEAIVTAHPDWTIYRGEGDSMAPRFDVTHLLIVKEVSAEALKPGMVALFHDASGDLVAHTVVRNEGGQLISQGLNNRLLDPAPIPSEAVVGVLIGTLAANEAIPESYELPVAVGKTY